MRTKRRLGSVLGVVLAAALMVAGLGGSARAQTSTTGVIRGTITDGISGKVLNGVTVVVTSPALQGSQAAITDGAGRYYISNLPPGIYLASFYYADAKVQRKDIRVRLGAVRVVNQRIDPQQGEVIVIEDRGTIIDPTSTNQGTRITQDQMRNIPVPGRTFSATLGQAPGSTGDAGGVAFSGSTSPENRYVIDGVDTTGLNYGNIGSPLLNEFIEEIQVLTGGYQAEYGRATGGVVNVVTKQGSNQFSGSVFSTIVPYTVNRTPVRPVSSSIEGVFDLDYSADFGFDLGGPLVKDKVWFYVGFAPQLSRTNVTRIVKSQTDCRRVEANGELSVCDRDLYQDGSIDLDPETDLPIFQEVDRESFKTSGSYYQFVSKLNFAVSPEHQGQISFSGTPGAGEGLFGVTGSSRATRAEFQALTTDLAAKWTSKFDDNRTEFELVAGWHRDKYDQDSLDSIADQTPSTRVYFSTLSHFGQAGNESSAVLNGCNDAGTRGEDLYPFIENCPVFQYWLDSPGFTIGNLQERRSLAAKLTRRASLVGDHVLRAGLDVEDNRTGDRRQFTGGRFNQLIHGGFNQVRVYRYVSPDPVATDICGFEEDEEGVQVPRACEYLDNADVVGRTVNWSAFAQDSWQIQPNITLNLGLRYEEQRLRNAEHIQGTIDPFSGRRLHKNAIKLRNMWAPRFGALYDWTKEGRSKVYSSFGRYYESIPMALNDFSFSGDTLYGAFFSFGQCANGDAQSQDSLGRSPSPYNCPESITTAPESGDTYRGGTTLVTPGTKAQYLDEAIVGVEYEVLEDFTLGASLKTRRIGRVLEDVSIDDADTYIIGNPGQFDRDEERVLERRLALMDEGSDDYNEALAQLEGFRRLREFDKPRRDYDALEITATKRFSRKFYVQSSYVYSRTRGNYPGLLNADTGAALPNISTQYDLIELLPNRDGALPQDRPHYFKFDSYYTHDFGALGILTGGVRFRALSGTPIDLLGSHHRYGFGESYLLPRGSQGRTEFVTNTDLHAAYARKLSKGYELSVFVQVINLFNQEQTSATDELYTFDNTNPIVGGSRDDLIWAKQRDAGGGETRDPLTRNIAYSTPLGRYQPLYLRLGARLTF